MTMSQIMSLKIKMACKILIYKPFRHYLWCGAGLNRRHKDFQSFALPTELPHRLRPPGGLVISKFHFNLSGRRFTLKVESVFTSFRYPLSVRRPKAAKIREFLNSPKGFHRYNKLKIR